VFAEIVAPGIGTANKPGLVALRELLRTDCDGHAYYWKANLRVCRVVGATGRAARSGPGDDVAARAIGEIAGRRDGPLRSEGGDVLALPRRQAAGDTQRLQKALSNRVGLAAGQPPRPRRRIQALDRDHIGYAEFGEGVAHIAF